MGTFSKAYVNVDKIEIVKKIIGKYYEIGSEEIENNEQTWKFFQNGSDTIILSRNNHEDWVEMILNLDFSLYFYDELLRRISKELNTEILLGYYQSTCIEGRLAKFKNGELQISIIQKEVQFGTETEGKMRLTDDWGVTKDLRKEFLIPRLKEEYSEIECDVIYKFYKINGIEWEELIREEEIYHHIEIKYE